MLIDSIDPEMLVIFMIGLFCLALIVYVDRYLARRRSLWMNDDYVKRMHIGRRNSRLHLVGAEHQSRPNRWRQDLVIEPEIEVRRPGFFSRQRNVTDTFGRVVATHYEEFVINDLQGARPRLLLTSGTTNQHANAAA
jgi:hypothetical protein